jgi:glucose-1-phosphate cytidylyltransferase
MVKTVILAGGLGTRLSEETQVRPKPMVEIGGRPILWHIMNIYAARGYEDFVIALGYKSEVIKDYFINFYALNNDITVNLRKGTTEVHGGQQPNWQVDLIDTGTHTQTGGRIRRLQQVLGSETFFATYGDGLADINVAELLQFHHQHGKIATVTAVHAPSRFGELVVEGSQVVDFAEKPCPADNWISGGFYVFQPEIFDYIAGDDVPLERAPMEALVSDEELAAYKLESFWHPMDTLRDKNFLEELWQSGNAPWKVWDSSANSLRRAA